MRLRNNIPVLLMLMAIVAIIIFQAYWLRKNYEEEKQTMHLRTNVLFREAVMQCQAEKLQLDSNIKFRFPAPANTVEMLNAVKVRLRDTTRHPPKSGRPMVITIDREKRKTADPEKADSLMLSDSNVTKQRVVYNIKGDAGLVRILRDVDSLQDSVTVKEVETRYNKYLQQEAIDLPFTIERKAGSNEMPYPPGLEANNNEVTIGFVHPYTFVLTVQDTASYLLKKLTPQIAVSLSLVGLTVFSFLLLYRNMKQQQRLTQLKNDFISNITHELKTPLATVSVAIEALKNFNVLQQPEKTKEYLEISGNELQRLALLVDKVLKLSMFEKQQVEYHPAAFDMKRLVEETVASMRLQVEKHDAVLKINTAGSDFTITADRLHISSVLFNLLDNALKYSNTNPEIEVALNESANLITLTVTDNGIGIPTEYQKKIFDKFFRVPSGNTHNVKGYGLGLSYVAYVVKLHKGTIELQSHEGNGSTFIIKLPKQHG